VEAPEEHLSTQRVEVEERIRAGRKRAKKLRHRMANRWMFVWVCVVCVCVCCVCVCVWWVVCAGGVCVG